jgi:hypothetical protein
VFLSFLYLLLKITIWRRRKKSTPRETELDI